MHPLGLTLASLTVHIDCSVVRRSGVFMWAGCSEISNRRTRGPLLMRWQQSSCFWEQALMSWQTKHEGQDSEAVWERNSCFSHLCLSSTQQGHVSHPRARRGAATVRHSWITRANCVSWRLIYGDKCDFSSQRGTG